MEANLSWNLLSGLSSEEPNAGINRVDVASPRVALLLPAGTPPYSAGLCPSNVMLLSWAVFRCYTVVPSYCAGLVKHLMYFTVMQVYSAVVLFYCDAALLCFSMLWCHYCALLCCVVDVLSCLLYCAFTASLLFC